MRPAENLPWLMAVDRPWGRKKHQGFFSCSNHCTGYVHCTQSVMAGEAELIKHEPWKGSLYCCGKEPQALSTPLCKGDLRRPSFSYSISQDFEK